MQWIHISSQTPPVTSCVYILSVRPDLYSSTLTQVKLLSNHDCIHMKDTRCFQVVTVTSQSQTLFFSMTFANSPVQTKQWCGVMSRKQSPLFREGALGSTSRVWTWRRPGKTIRETRDFINWWPASAYLLSHRWHLTLEILSHLFSTTMSHNFLSIFFPSFFPLRNQGITMESTPTLCFST